MNRIRILSLDLTSGRLGFAYFEGMDLIDWGIKGTPKGSHSEQRSIETLESIQDLIKNFEPDVLLMPEISKRRSEVSKKALIKAARIVASSIPLDVIAYSWTEVRKIFRVWTEPNRPTKQRIMGVVSDLFPELRPIRPKPRRMWEPQDYWLPMFDAVARAVAWIDKTEPDSIRPAA
jgi:hypothetical protein